MRYIPADKMAKLREASKAGDERARKILFAQLDGNDFDSDLEEYFKPAPAPEAQNAPIEAKATGPETPKAKAGLDSFLESNGVTKESPEYDDFVNDYYAEFPNERPEEAAQAEVGEEVDLTKSIAEGLIDIIGRCDQTLVLVLNNDDVEDTAKKGIMTTLQEIKQSILDNFDKVRKIKKSLCGKNEEKEETKPENPEKLIEIPRTADKMI